MTEKTLGPCPHCGCHVILNGDGRHPCAFCGGPLPPSTFAVFDARDECYALCPSQTYADLAKVNAERYLDDASDSAHPTADEWVDERLPLRVESISLQRAREIRENAPPVLEWEP